MLREIARFTIACLICSVLLSSGCGGGSTTPETMILFESTEHGFSIEYPEGWSENVQEAGTQFSFDFTESEGLLAASVYLHYGCEEVTSEDFLAQGEEYLSSMPGYELITERDVVVGGGFDGHEIVAKGDLGTGHVEKFRFVLLVRERQGFWYGVHGESAEFDDQENTVEAIMESFQVLSSYTYDWPKPWSGGEYVRTGFSIIIPAGWCRYPVLRTEHVCHFEAADQSISVHVSPQQLPEDTTPEEYVDNVVEDLPSSGYWANFDLVSKQSVNVSGLTAYELVFTGTSDLSPGYMLKCKYLVVFHEEEVFWVMAVTDPDLFEQHEAVIDHVIYSFRIG